MVAGHSAVRRENGTARVAGTCSARVGRAFRLTFALIAFALAPAQAGPPASQARQAGGGLAACCGKEPPQPLSPPTRPRLLPRHRGLARLGISLLHTILLFTAALFPRVRDGKA